jgi:hypothetical protein
MKILKSQEGAAMTIAIIMLIAVSVFIVTAVSVINLNLGNVVNNERNQKALGIAEAGVNYYMWHLNHAPNDITDNACAGATNTADGYGPCVHNFIDSNGEVTGTFTLYIKQKVLGSTIINVKSIGQVNGSTIKRTIDADIGAPSFASYALATNMDIYLGANEGVSGKIHSNTGIRMDWNGPYNDTISSSSTTYVPIQGATNPNPARPGVWSNNYPSKNTPAGKPPQWQYPVNSLPFSSVMSQLCLMKKAAFANVDNTANSTFLSNSDPCSVTNGTQTNSYTPRYASAYDDKKGYLIKLKTNGTYTIQKVTDTTTTSNSKTPTTYSNRLVTDGTLTTYNIPTSGIVFVEDNVWVVADSGFTGRLTIASARPAEPNLHSGTNIVIASDLKYIDTTGKDVLGLATQGSVIVAPYAPGVTGINNGFTLDINAAILTAGTEALESGCAWMPVNYPSKKCTKAIYNSCNSSNNTSPSYNESNQHLKFLGSIAIGGAMFNWSNNCAGAGQVVGVINNETAYDTHMLWYPPPLWPTTTTFQILRWREVLKTL